MITHYPLANPATAPSPSQARNEGKPPILRNAGSWRYDGDRSSRILLACAVAVSAGLHLGILFGIGPPKPKKAAAQADDSTIALIAMPQLKDLEEPEPVYSDDSGPPVDLGALVPMQQDVPSLPQPSDFVQQFNFASLIEPPDFSQAKVYVIPEHIRTGGNLAEKIGKIFNPEDLDRVPQAILQPSPVYPVALKREAASGTVVVEFIVDTQGRVLNPIVVDSTHRGFDDAAVAGVGRWKFKPGVRGGRTVNTRMRVPIVFRTVDADT